MVNVLNYQIAKFHIDTYQFKMLQMIFTINSEEVRSFCISSLVKDKVLIHCNRDLTRFGTSEVFFHDVMKKYYYNFDVKLASKEDETGYDLNQWIKETFLDLLKAYETVRQWANSYHDYNEEPKNIGDSRKMIDNSAIILNTLIDHKALIFKDPAFADITLDDFKE